MTKAFLSFCWSIKIFMEQLAYSTKLFSDKKIQLFSSKHCCYFVLFQFYCLPLFNPWETIVIPDDNSLEFMLLFLHTAHKKKLLYKAFQTLQIFFCSNPLANKTCFKRVLRTRRFLHFLKSESLFYFLNTDLTVYQSLFKHNDGTPAHF